MAIAIYGRPVPGCCTVISSLHHPRIVDGWKGRAVAGGAPLSGIAGRRDILMQMYDGVASGGSFNGNPISLA